MTKRTKPANYERQTVKETVESDFEIVDGIGTIDDVILRLQATKKKYAKKDVTVFLKQNISWDYQEIEVVIRRQENDAEYEKRIAWEEKAYQKYLDAERKKEEKELALLAELKAKYEG